MKRLIFLICAVVLLLDLGAGGSLGNPKFVSSHNHAQSSVTSSQQSSGKADAKAALPPENCGDSGPEFIGRPVSGGIVQSLY
jgi:hypothetical protein